MKPDVPASLQQSAAQVIASVCINNGKNAQIVVNELGLHSLVVLLESVDAAVLDHVLSAICNILEENRRFSVLYNCTSG